jgi:hypothetical protein
MAFKLYQDKSSLQNPNCRMVRGGTPDTVGNFLGYWEKLEIPKDPITDETFTITLDFAFRADKISYKLYGRDDFEWLILQYNNVIDINEELGVGAILIVPSYARTMYNLMNN